MEVYQVTAMLPHEALPLSEDERLEWDWEVRTVDYMEEPELEAEDDEYEKVDETGYEPDLNEDEDVYEGFYFNQDRWPKLALNVCQNCPNFKKSVLIKRFIDQGPTKVLLFHCAVGDYPEYRRRQIPRNCLYRVDQLRYQVAHKLMEQ